MTFQDVIDANNTAKNQLGRAVVPRSRTRLASGCFIVPPDRWVACAGRAKEAEVIQTNPILVNI